MRKFLILLLLLNILSIVTAEEITFPDNSIYIGETQNGILSGQGKLLWPNGVSYEGEFSNGLMSGQGIYSTPFGVYLGNFKNGFFDGQGKFKYSNGDVYVGEYKTGFLDGKGALNYTNGDRYLGEFKNNYIDGFGLFTYKNGNQYKGEFKLGYFHGKGSLKTGDRVLTGEFYEGKYLGSDENEISFLSKTNFILFFLIISLIFNLYLFISLRNKSKK